MTRIAIAGANGRMGRELILATLKNDQCTLSLATCRSNSDSLGVDAGLLAGEDNTGTLLTDEPDKHIDSVDIFIDFTSPAATMMLLDTCLRHKKGIVIGTTGFTTEQKQLIHKAAHDIPIVLSPNMSASVNLMFKLLEITANVLGKESDIEIIEKHHRNKLDAPSGTALKMGEVIADTLELSMEKCAVYGREGTEKQSRPHDIIGFSSIRAGDIVGEHTAIFASEGEQLEITHRSSSRMNYAKGAVQAAAWLHHRPCGLYDMQDVLGI